MKSKITAANLLIYTEHLIPENLLNEQTANLIGGFEKKILLISTTLAEGSEEKILLEKMLTATKLSQADIYHLQLDEKKPIFPLIAQLAPTKIISFGAYLDNASTTFSNQLYNVIEINNYELLTTHTLAKIAADSQLKQALWNGLKKMFTL